MFVKPKEGLRVLRPETRRPLPEAGAEVPDGDHYWTRRLMQGDVEIVDHPADEPETDKPVQAKE